MINRKKWRIRLRNPFCKSNPSNFNTLSSGHPNSLNVISEKMYITVHKAIGGYVLEWNYNNNDLSEEMHSSLHLILNDEDLGQSIAKIITLEMMRK